MQSLITADVIARFEPKRGLSDLDGHRIWTAATFTNGYGAFRVGPLQMKAHVVAFLMASGLEIIDPRFRVCHTCDLKLCTQNSGPEGVYVVRGTEYRRFGHLWLGTQLANLQDRNDKNRQAKGDRQGLRVHPDRRATGERNGAVTHPERVRRGDDNGARKHPERMSHGATHPKAKLVDKQVLEMRALRRTGTWTLSMLSRQFGVNTATVHNICTYKIWKDLP